MSMVTWWAEMPQRRLRREQARRTRPPNMPHWTMPPEIAAHVRELAAQRAAMADVDDPGADLSAAHVSLIMYSQDLVHARELARLERWIVVLTAVMTVETVALLSVLWWWR